MSKIISNFILHPSLENRQYLKRDEIITGKIRKNSKGKSDQSVGSGKYDTHIIRKKKNLYLIKYDLHPLSKVGQRNEGFLK